MLRQSENDRLLPISPARVQSQINNPFAEGNDVALVAAFLGDQCVGYHGLLPGFFISDEKITKIHWATTFYVAPVVRGRGVGKSLIDAITNLDIDFAVTGMTESAQRAYLSKNLKTLGYLDFCQLRIDRLEQIFQKKGKRFSRKWNESLSTIPAPVINRAKRVFYRFLKKIFYLSQPLSPYLRSQQFVAKEVQKIKGWPEQSNIVEQKTPRFYRGLPVINWMLKYPWVFTYNENIKEKDFYFTTTREFFTYKAFEIYPLNSTTILGYCVVSIFTNKGRTVVKVLDFAFQSPEYEKIAIELALQFGSEFLADKIEYPAELNRFVEPHRRLRKYIKKQKRLYLFSPKNDKSPMLQQQGKIDLDYCDADTSFS
ncbi:MAG: GNAT family N-acetyltransferase [Desulforhopalus sp.]